MLTADEPSRLESQGNVHHMDLLPAQIIEWFVVPLAMYLLLFWWRDNLNILHMPLADLVALLVIADVAIADVAIADVAIALNFPALPDLLRFLHLDASGTPRSPYSFWRLTGLGVVVCALLIYKIEKRILSTALHHMSVGLWHRSSSHYLRFWAACRNTDWRLFMARWASGFAVTAIVITVHLMVVGAHPLRALNPYFAGSNDRWLVELVLIGAGIFCIFLVLGTFLTAIRYFRFSVIALPWTYLSNDESSTV
jgi:hypothetical protein